ncbi:MAG TPA: hypothetical protein VGD31_15140 [Sphingobacteriaceae bacterium]
MIFPDDKTDKDLRVFKNIKTGAIVTVEVLFEDLVKVKYKSGNTQWYPIREFDTNFNPVTEHENTN